MPHHRPSAAHTVQIAEPTKHGGAVSWISETGGYGYNAVSDVVELHGGECEHDMKPSVVEASEERRVNREGLVWFLRADIDPGAVGGCGGVADYNVFYDEEDEAAYELSGDEFTWLG